MAKFVPYPKYKDSGIEWIGDVPDGWEIKQSKYLFLQKKEPRKVSDEQLSATQRYGVIPQRLFMETQDQKVVLALAGLDGFKHVQQDDFVISLRSFQGGIEHCKYDGCVSPAYTVLRAFFNFHSTYWAYLFKNALYIQALQLAVVGIREGKNIPYESFGIIQLPLPSLDEQQAIAAFLDRETAHIDTLITKKNRLIELLKEKRQATITQAVTKGLNANAKMKDSGIEWIGEVPEGWIKTRVGRLAQFIQTGPFGSQLHFKDYIMNGVPVINPAHIKNGIIVPDISCSINDVTVQRLSRHILQPADIVFGRRGEMGRCAVVSQEHSGCLCGTGCLQLRPLKNIFVPYLSFFLQSNPINNYLKNYSVGSTMDNLNTTILANIPIFTPPLQEQHAIAAYLDTQCAKLDTLIAKTEQSIALLKEKRSALITAAVTGKIDVREAVC